MFNNLNNNSKIILLSLFFLFFGIILYIPGLFSIDDVTYFFMAHYFTENHSYEIWNGFDEFETTYFGIFEPVYHKHKMFGKYPPLYPVIAYPFYLFFGLKGLFYLNIISFSLTILILYKFSNLLLNNPSLSVLACIIYSFCTFSFEYALGLWPHMLSVFLSLSAYLLFELSFHNDKERNSILILSGFLTGVSVGIRLQNIIIAGVISLTILIFSDKKLKNLFSFLEGLLLVVSVIAYINYYRFGSMDPFSYGHYKGKNIKFFLEYPELLLLFAAFFLFVYLFFRFKDIIFARKKKFIKPLLVSFSFLVLILLLADPKWTFFNFLKNIYANVIDLSPFFDKDLVAGQRADIAYFGHIKKSLLQSCPFLILSIFSYFAMRKDSYDRRKSFLLISGFLLQLLFISSFFFHGGFAFNVRYALELLPFAVILCLYAIKDLETTKNHIILVSILSILFIIQNMFLPIQLFLKQLLILYFPLFLSAAIIVLFLLKNPTSSSWIKYFFNLIVLLSFTYGIAITFTEDILGSRRIRKKHQETTNELNTKIKNDSLVIMEVDKTVAISSIKAVKKVRIAIKGEQYRALVDFYLKKNNPVYLISNKQDYLLIEKDFARYNLKIIPSNNFLLCEIIKKKES